MPRLVNLDTCARRGWYPVKWSRKTLLDYLLDIIVVVILFIIRCRLINAHRFIPCLVDMWFLFVGARILAIMLPWAECTGPLRNAYGVSTQCLSYPAQRRLNTGSSSL